MCLVEDDVLGDDDGFYKSITTMVGQMDPWPSLGNITNLILQRVEIQQILINLMAMTM